MAAATDNPRSVGRRVIWPSTVRPLLARAAQTVLGQPSRQAIARALDEAELPPALRDLLVFVVRRARLWRREQLDVTRELASHFRDGLASGATPEDLQASFGDARAAARLIRRAKRRGRPLWWHGWRTGLRAVSLILLLSVGLYIFLSLRYHLARPTISHDYIADYNAPILAVPEAERAWPLYREAIIALEPLPTELRDRWPIEYADDEKLADGRAYLDRNTTTIALAHRAAERPLLGAILGDPQAETTHIERANRHSSAWLATHNSTAPTDPSLIGSPQTFLNMARELTRLLRSDLTVAIVNGDAARAERSVRTLMQIGCHADQGRFVISALVAMEVDGVLYDAIRVILNDRPELLTSEQCQKLAHAIAAAGDPGDRVAAALRAERTAFLDLVQRVYSDDGSGDGHMTARGMAFLTHTTYGGSGPAMRLIDEALMPLAAGTALSRSELIARYDKVIQLGLDEIQRPLWVAPAPEVFHAYAHHNENLYRKARNWPANLMVPGFSHATRGVHHHRVQRDATLAAIALELHRREHGSYPALLTALSPRYLPRLPVDPADGQPLRYRLAAGKPVIYSVGADGADDSGTPPVRGNIVAMPGVAAHQAAAAEDRRLPPVRRRGFLGDWVLYPLQRTPQASRPQS